MLEELSLIEVTLLQQIVQSMFQSDTMHQRIKLVHLLQKELLVWEHTSELLCIPMVMRLML
jgi:hypothetical protein